VPTEAVLPIRVGVLTVRPASRYPVPLYLCKLGALNHGIRVRGETFSRVSSAIKRGLVAAVFWGINKGVSPGYARVCATGTGKCSGGTAMPYDFRPYIRATKPAGGGPGKGVFIKLDDLYIFPDGHGNICAARDDELGLPGLNQPFADAYQGIEIISGILRAMAKKAKALQVMQSSQYQIGTKILIDTSTPGVVVSPWAGHHKVETANGVRHLLKASRVTRA
jgi:hypothetical protein